MPQRLWVRPTFPFIFNADLPDVDSPKGNLGPGNVPEFPDGPPRNIPPGGLPFTSYSGFGDIIYFALLGQSLPQQRWGGGNLSGRPV